MKFRFLLAAVLTFAPCLRAADPAPTAPTAPAAPAAETETEAETATEAKLKQLIGRITAKLEAGKHVEADFDGELAEFETLAEAAEPDEAAVVLLLKARFYLEVFDDSAKGVALFKRIVADYPKTEVALKLEAMIPQLEAQLAAEAKLAVGSVFPALGEPDLEGKPLDLSAYAGKIVLIDFWATWCGPCVAELPNVTAAYEKYHDRGFEIIGISLDKSRTALTDFLKANPMPWRHYFDGLGWQNKISTRFGIDSIPATFLLDGQGKIVAKDLRGDALDRKLATLLAPK